MFPIEVKFKKRFCINDSKSDNNDVIIDFYKEEFIKRKADNVRIEDNKVRFNNRLFKLISNWNIMAPIDKGILTVKKNNRNELVIEYVFSLMQIWILGGIVSIIIFLTSGSWHFGLVAFLWFCAVNWLIAVIRHSIMFRSLNEELKKIY